MKIVIDKDIPFAEQLFSSLGEVTLVEGRSITPAVVRDAGMLIVRTVTRVDQTLLQGSSVGFVGSTTSGVDHIERDYLDRHNISFAHAPGCNARSVAEYLFSSLCVLADQSGFDLAGKRLGVIGCGHVGGEVLRYAEALGMETLANDPPLQESSADPVYRDLEELLDADIITLHVPLTSGGAWPTRNLLNGELLGRLKPDVILVNTARGAVVDESALLAALTRNPAMQLVVDTWGDEPRINVDLLNRAAIATPHIAGYSLDGKLRGSRMVYQQACLHLGVECRDSMVGEMLEKLVAEVPLIDCEDDMEAIQMAVLASYDVRSDSAMLRRIMEIEAGGRAEFFDSLRNGYGIRREFHAMQLRLSAGSESLAGKLTALGFQVTLE